VTAEAEPTITNRQREVYDFIRDEYHGRGYGLTVREVAARFGWTSPNAAAIHLKRLKAAGLVTWEPNASRTIRPMEAAL
jgi:repressor LexA